MVQDWHSVLLQVVQRILHVNGIPQNHSIGDQAKSAQLILLSLAIAFTDFTSAAVANYARQIMPFFGAI